ncbi:hypothetical protein GCM10011512_16120 [Tersicoccus solisilvae]|uniref:Uncharacterized protein n=1 Tax=Tersicoccus solisilvae TaxID=1882339 RepID=A0ABQ1P667_9MICC|nr:hypothetical protein GCM10011512_16120 [Tersicoccus solisilvae]
MLARDSDEALDSAGPPQCLDDGRHLDGLRTGAEDRHDNGHGWLPLEIETGGGLTPSRLNLGDIAIGIEIG